MVTTSEKCGKDERPLKGKRLVSKAQLNSDIRKSIYKNLK